MLTEERAAAGRRKSLETRRAKAAERRASDVDSRGRSRNSRLDSNILTEADVRRAQLAVARSVLEDATVPACDREDVLAELLDALGILRPTARLTAAASATRKLTCVGSTGTVRGYRLHLRGYETPCVPCWQARTAELNERYTTLGITIQPNSKVELPT